MLPWCGSLDDEYPRARHILRHNFLRLVEFFSHSLLSQVLGMLRVETPNYAAEAHRLITLSRACLTLDSAISNTTIMAVNAMLLHVAYLLTALVPHGHSRAEATLGMIVRLAQSVGTSYLMKVCLTCHSDRTSVRPQTEPCFRF
jgi:hypothetical protein